MKKIFFTLLVLLFVFVNLRTSAQGLKNDEQVETLRSQISALNLINGMFLTKDQLIKYLDVLKDKKDLDDKYQKKFNGLKSELAENFNKLLKDVGENKGISKDVQEKANGINKEEKDLAEDYKLKLIDLENNIEAFLTENQKCIIDEFKPCLIPPKNLRDPARVGQAKGDASSVVSELEKIKDVPPKRYEKVKSKFIERYLEEYEKKISVLSADEKQKLINQVAGIIDEVRSMPKVDFEMKKEEIGKELILDKMKKEKRKKYEVGKTGKILLEESLIPIIEKRISGIN
jgi:hypothetical protein